MKLNLMLGFLVSMMLTSCTTRPTVTQEQQVKVETMKNDLIGGKWVLDYMSPVDGKDVKALYKIQKPYLKFIDNDKVAGNNGCNNISGGYEFNGNSITFFTDKFASTRMFCQGVNERAFVDMLKTINNYEIIDDGSKLILLTSDIHSMILLRVED